MSTRCFNYKTEKWDEEPHLETDEEVQQYLPQGAIFQNMYVACRMNSMTMPQAMLHVLERQFPKELLQMKILPDLKDTDS